MLLPPRGYVGQVNAGDFLTRLLHDVVVTGIAPRSFYAASAAPRFDGVPVDFAARSIAAIARATEPGASVFHVVAGRKSEGVSLDTLVDWVAQAGYPVKRMVDHAAWIRAFQERLGGLREEDQQRSTLPILRMWERPIERTLAFDDRHLLDRLTSLGEGEEAPRVDFLFVQQYLKNMIYRGIIGHPDLTAAA
jgi:fatty acid CoA ligase FadD9